LIRKALIKRILHWNASPAVVKRWRLSVLLLVLQPFVSLPSLASGQWSQQVRLLILRKQLHAAEEMIVSQMVTKPRDPELITLLAEVRLDQGRLPEALDLLKDADSLGGTTALRAMLMGLVQIAAGRLNLAESQFRKAIKLDPDYASAHYFLARVLYTKNQFEPAIKESKKAIAISPNLVRAYENVGLCYEGEQQFQEAKRWYLRAISHQTPGMRTEWPMLDLATMLIRQGRLIEAKPYLRAALAFNPHNSHAVFEEGVLMEKSGKLQEALKQFDEAARIDPHWASPHYRAGRICQLLGYSREAQMNFETFKRISERDHTKHPDNKPVNTSGR
jgi:tetratricopeptide (TPR) repeat protein